MGETLIYICPNCGNNVHLDYGSDFMWYKNDISIFYPHKTKPYEFNIYSCLSPRIRKEVKDFIENIGEPLAIKNVRSQPYKCEKCGKIYSKIYFEIISPKIGVQTYIPQYYCSCHGVLKKIKPTQKHFYCHKCKTELVKSGEIMWD